MENRRRVTYQMGFRNKLNEEKNLGHVSMERFTVSILFPSEEKEELKIFFKRGSI